MATCNASSGISDVKTCISEEACFYKSWSLHAWKTVQMSIRAHTLAPTQMHFTAFGTFLQILACRAFLTPYTAVDIVDVLK